MEPHLQAITRKIDRGLAITIPHRNPFGSPVTSPDTPTSHNYLYGSGRSPFSPVYPTVHTNPFTPQVPTRQNTTGSLSLPSLQRRINQERESLEQHAEYRQLQERLARQEEELQRLRAASSSIDHHVDLKEVVQASTNFRGRHSSQTFRNTMEALCLTCSDVIESREDSHSLQTSLQLFTRGVRAAVSKYHPRHSELGDAVVPNGQGNNVLKAYLNDTATVLTFFANIVYTW